MPPPGPLVLVKRLGKGFPLTPAEEDNNKTLIEEYINGFQAELNASLNPDGTLKDNSVSTTAIQDQAVTLAKLAFLSSFYRPDTGAANALAITWPPDHAALTAYAAGLVFYVKAVADNTGASTLKVDALAPVAIKKWTQSGISDTQAGDIKAGNVYILVHDGTQFVLCNPTPGSGTVKGILTLWNPITVATLNVATTGWVTNYNISGSVPAGASAVILAADVTMESNNPGGSFWQIQVRPDALGGIQTLLYCVAGTNTGAGNYQQAAYLFASGNVGPGIDRHFDYIATLSGSVTSLVSKIYLLGYVS